jgi:hypothetical protein
MKRKIGTMLSCILMIIALSGCQLAIEDAGANVVEDKLVGVFITTEHLDLFDMEGYLNDNLSGFGGGSINLGEKTEKYQGRIYAELAAKALTSEETGETFEIEEYVFPIDGISYFSATVPAKGNQDSYFTSISDPAISDGHVDYKEDDGSDSITLTGTIYVSTTGAERNFFFNPVYQSADGSVYLTAGTGMTAPMDDEGVSMSTTMDSTTTATENGETKTDSISITLSVSTMFAPEKIVILQMGADNAVLSMTEYPPNAMPTSISVNAKTAYLMIETHKRGNTEETKISREIYDKDAESIGTFYLREDGVCVKQWTQVNYTEIVGDSSSVSLSGASTVPPTAFL